MKTIDLNDLSFNDGAGVVIELDEGMWAKEVTNQVGGCACRHPKATGIVRIVATFSGLHRHFSDEDSEYTGLCGVGISEKTADFLDACLAHLHFKVDRSKLKESQEAWIFGFYEGKPAVLTWGNSD